MVMLHMEARSRSFHNSSVPSRARQRRPATLGAAYRSLAAAALSQLSQAPPEQERHPWRRPADAQGDIVHGDS